MNEKANKNAIKFTEGGEKNGLTNIKWAIAFNFSFCVPFSLQMCCYAAICNLLTVNKTLNCQCFMSKCSYPESHFKAPKNEKCLHVPNNESKTHTKCFDS